MNIWILQKEKNDAEFYEQIKICQKFVKHWENFHKLREKMRNFRKTKNEKWERNAKNCKIYTKQFSLLQTKHWRSNSWDDFTSTTFALFLIARPSMRNVTVNIRNSRHFCSFQEVLNQMSYNWKHIIYTYNICTCGYYAKPINIMLLFDILHFEKKTPIKFCNWYKRAQALQLG